MKEKKEELEKDVADIQEDTEIDTEATEDSGVSDVEAEEFERLNLKAEMEELEDKYLRARAEIANIANRSKMSVNNYKNIVHKILLKNYYLQLIT